MQREIPEMQAALAELFAPIQVSSEIQAVFDSLRLRLPPEIIEMQAALAQLSFQVPPPPKIEISPEIIKMEAEIAEMLETLEFLDQIALVPHPMLWHSFEEMRKRAEGAFCPKQIATDVWSSRSSCRFNRELSECLNDEKLTRLYAQVLAAHSRGDYEIALSALPAIFERVTRLVRPANESAITWLAKNEHIRNLYPQEIGGYPGYRVWRVLCEHCFSNFDKTDDAADAMRYPNRHVIAHGAGNRLADVVQSLNAVLLAHLMIWLGSLVRQKTENVS
jgi:hypothetical protein